MSSPYFAASPNPTAPPPHPEALRDPQNGLVLSIGYSREADPHNHAEEVALSKLTAGDPRLDLADEVKKISAYLFQ